MFSRPLRSAAWLFIVAGLALIRTAGANPPEENAALWYWRAFEHLHHAGGTEFNEQVLAYLEEPETRDDDAFATIADDAEKILENFVRASTKPFCAYGIDWSMNLLAELPHLSQIRSVARAAKAVALYEMAQGNTDRAIELAVAMIHASRHTAEDEILLSRLVGAALFVMTEDLIDELMDGAALERSHILALRSSLDTLDPEEPFGQGAAPRCERRMLSALRESCRTDAGRAAFAEFLDGIGHTESLAHLSPDALDSAIASAIAHLDTFQDAFDANDADAVAAAGAYNTLSEAGPVALWMLPSFGGVYRNRDLTRERLAALKERVDTYTPAPGDDRDDPAGSISPPEAALAFYTGLLEADVDAANAMYASSPKWSAERVQRRRAKLVSIAQTMSERQLAIDSMAYRTQNDCALVLVQFTTAESTDRGMLLPMYLVRRDERWLLKPDERSLVSSLEVVDDAGLRDLITLHRWELEEKAARRGRGRTYSYDDALARLVGRSTRFSTDPAFLGRFLRIGLDPALPSPSRDGTDLLTSTVKWGTAECVALLLQHGADPDTRTSGFNKTPLFQAAYDGDLPIIEVLLDGGATVTAVDAYDNNALREAILGGHPDVVTRLLDAGADPEQTNTDGDTMRDLARKHGSEPVKRAMGLSIE